MVRGTRGMAKLHKDGSALLQVNGELPSAVIKERKAGVARTRRRRDGSFRRYRSCRQ
jgi:hypothetical protein